MWLVNNVIVSFCLQYLILVDTFSLTLKTAMYGHNYTIIRMVKNTK